MEYKEIAAKKFLQRLQDGELNDSFLLDVREPYEWMESHLSPVNLIPLNSLPAKLSEIPKDKPVYCICAHGIRSYYATMYLLKNGFSEVINVLGGMAEIERYIPESGLESLWKREDD